MLRSTDHANVWGVVRGRDDGALPKAITLRMVAGDSPDGPAVAEATPTPNAHGMFTADLAFKDLPVGSYQVTMTADGVDLGASYVQVGPIVKPQYQLDVTTDLHAMLTGTRVKATTAATFFDGTPVAGVGPADVRPPIRAAARRKPTRGQRDDRHRRPSATATVRPRLTGALRDGTQWSWIPIDAVPTPTRRRPRSRVRPTWPSSAPTHSSSTDARVDGSTLRVTGSVHAVDFAEDGARRLTGLRHRPGRRAPSRRHRPPADHPAHRCSPTGRDRLRLRDEAHQPDLPVRPAGDASCRRSRCTRVPTGPSRRRSASVRATATTTSSPPTPTGRGARWPRDAYATRYSDQSVPRQLRGRGADQPRRRSLSRRRHDQGPRARRSSTTGRRPLPLPGHASRPPDRRRSSPARASRPTFRSAWIPSLRISAVRFNGYGYDVDTAGYSANLDTHDQTLRVTVRPTPRATSPVGRPTSRS